ncbi:MAG: hypothetical protein NC548_32315 [Lachnospiraceae bacterium]|nr:hypothetical protein [Lachnospiraceae bacterium]
MIETLNAFAKYMQTAENIELTVMQANSNGHLVLPSLVYQIVQSKPYRAAEGYATSLVLWQVDLYCDQMQGDLVRGYDNLVFLSTCLNTWLQTYPPRGMVNPNSQNVVFVPHTPGDKITYIRCTHRFELMDNREYQLKLPSVDEFEVEANQIGN